MTKCMQAISYCNYIISGEDELIKKLEMQPTVRKRKKSEKTPTI